MKKIIVGTGLLFLACFARSQNGLENVIVEKYYVSNAADAAGSVGMLPQGSVTYRIYADMLPGYKFQALYGVTGHELRIQSSAAFFNNEDRGAKEPNFTKAQAADNSVMLDSWFSTGGASSDFMGVLKSEDDGTANVTNNNGILANNDPEAGIPLTTQDGFIAGTPEAVTFVGFTNELDVFNNASQSGNLFSTTNGSIASLNGSVGPTAANKVLIGQFTTRGTFSFELNIQIGTPGGGVQNFVANNPVGGEIQLASLTYSNTTCSGAPAAPASVSGNTAVCLNSNPVFSVTDNGFMYSWSVSTTAMGIINSQPNDSAVLSLSPVFTAGTLSVTAGDDCGISGATILSLTKSANLKPVLTGTISTSVENVCPVMGTETNVTYSIPSVPNAASYTWTVPAGVTLVSGQGTNTIVVNYSGAYVSGGIGVKAISDCGNVFSTEKKLTPKKTKPATPKAIIGPSGTLAKNVCSIMGTASDVSYYVSLPVLYATSYLWTVPTGATITSGQGTDTIKVNFSTSFAGGDIAVIAVSGCGSSTAKKLKIAAPKIPVTPLAVYGPSALCGYADILVGMDYAIAPILGATSYTWTVPAGITITSGGTSTNMHAILDTNVFSGPGNITVSSVSGCGTSVARSYSVTEGHISPIVSGFPLVCGGTTTNYSVPALANATSYNWTVIGSNTTTVTHPSGNTCSIDWGTKGGKISVTVTGCGITSAALAKPFEVKLGKCNRFGVLITDEMLSVYPNPALVGNNIILSLGGLDDSEGAATVVTMYDVLGKPVYTNQGVYYDMFENVINTQGFAPGMYIVTVQIGEEMFTQKLILTSY